MDGMGSEVNNKMRVIENVYNLLRNTVVFHYHCRSEINKYLSSVCNG